MATKAVKPAPLTIPTAPVLLQAVGREVRLKIPDRYTMSMLEARQVSRGGVYEPLLVGFGGAHTDPDKTIVVPGLGTDYEGEFRVRMAASTTNQAGKELIITNPAKTAAKPPTSTPLPAPAPAAPALPVPEAPILVAFKNLDGSWQLPAGTTVDQLEIELS
jgi:hypothetical protein